MIVQQQVVATFLQEIRDFLKIYTWIEVWVVVTVAAGLVGIWYIFSLELMIENIIFRSAAIWALVILLSGGAAATDYLRKRKS
jgi:hypothetical protein